MDKLQDILYQPNHLWKRPESHLRTKRYQQAKTSSNQEMAVSTSWQVHLPSPKHVDRPHYEVKIPNEMHQFDLLYMPRDTLYGNK